MNPTICSFEIVVIQTNILKCQFCYIKIPVIYISKKRTSTANASNFSYKLMGKKSMAPYTKLRTSVCVRHCANPWTSIIPSLYHNPVMLELLLPFFRWGNWGLELTNSLKVPQHVFVNRPLRENPHPTCPELQFPLRDTGFWKTFPGFYIVL